MTRDGVSQPHLYPRRINKGGNKSEENHCSVLALVLNVDDCGKLDSTSNTLGNGLVMISTRKDNIRKRKYNGNKRVKARLERYGG